MPVCVLPLYGAPVERAQVLGRQGRTQDRDNEGAGRYVRARPPRRSPATRRAYFTSNSRCVYPIVFPNTMSRVMSTLTGPSSSTTTVPGG